MNEGSGQKPWLILLFFGTIAVIGFGRGRWGLGLLALPIPFYALSVAYSGVPIFIPPWWPFSLYNVRYGIQLLPAFAVFSAVLGICAITLGNLRHPALKIAPVGGAADFHWTQLCPRLAVASHFVSRGVDKLPQPYRSRKGIGRNPECSPIEFQHPDVSGRSCGSIAARRDPVAQRDQRRQSSHLEAALRRRRFVGKSALQIHPGRYVDVVVAVAGDPVAEKVARQNLTSIAVIRATGQPECVI